MRWEEGLLKADSSMTKSNSGKARMGDRKDSKSCLLESQFSVATRAPS